MTFSPNALQCTCVTLRCPLMALLDSLVLPCHHANHQVARCTLGWDLIPRITRWGTTGLRAGNMVHKVKPKSRSALCC